MLSSIRGTVQSRQELGLIVEVHGIGLFVQTPHAEHYEINSPAYFFTHLHWNQETGPQLFGFATNAERTFFIKVIGCTGLGPKLALSLLNQAPLSTYVTAISLGNADVLKSIKGLGPKKAETLIREMHAKLDSFAEGAAADTPDYEFLQHLKDVRETLDALKYSSLEIVRTIDYLSHQHELKTTSFDHLLRVALTQLVKSSAS